MDKVEPQFSSKVIHLLTEKNKDTIFNQIADWGPMMWHAACFTVQAHGIAPLLYRVLTDLDVLDNFDKGFRDYIRDQYFLNRERIGRIQEILQTLLAQANYHHIPVMPLKGSILINSYYPDPAVRPMADIDLLIYPENIEQLSRLLESMGFRALVSYHHKVYTNSIKPVSFDGEHPDNPIKIELHHAAQWPIGLLDLDMTDVIWEKSENNYLGFSSIFSPARERLLLMLICHNARNQFNGWMRLFHLHDISIVTRRMDDEQWSELGAIVQEHGLERVMFSVLSIAKRFIGIDLPDGFLEEQKWNTPPKLQSQVKTQTLDSLIRLHEYKLLTLKLGQRSSQVNQQMFGIYQLILFTIVQSMKFNWFFSGKETKQEIIQVISPSNYIKDKWGNLLARIIYWLIIPIALVPIIVIGTHRREKLLSRLKISLLRHLYAPY